MKIAIDVAGFTPAESDGFRRAMGTWRSSGEMEKLHAQFVDGCIRVQRPDARAGGGAVPPGARRSPASASTRATPRRSPAPRTSRAFLKLFYPAQFVAGLINAQPMGFYPVEVLINDAKRHGVARPAGGREPELASGRPPSGWAGPAGRWRGPMATTGRTTAIRASRSPRAAGSTSGRRRCARPRAWSRARPRGTAGRRSRWPAGASAWGCTWSRASARRRRRGWTPSSPGGPYEIARRRGRADRAGGGGRRAADPGRARWTRSAGRGGSCCGSCARSPGRRKGRVDGRIVRGAGGRGKAAGRPLDLRLPATEAPRSAADHRARAAGRRLRDPVARRAAAGGELFRHGARPAGGGHQRARSPSIRRAGSGSAGWSSPASTR